MGSFFCRVFVCFRVGDSLWILGKGISLKIVQDKKDARQKEENGDDQIESVAKPLDVSFRVLFPSANNALDRAVRNYRTRNDEEKSQKNKNYISCLNWS